MYNCELCLKNLLKFETKAGNGFNSHLKKVHNNMSYKDYVVLTEFGGICPTCKSCNKELDLLKGTKVRFPTYCSHHCASVGENNGMHGKKGIFAPNKGAKRTEAHKEKYRLALYKRYASNPIYLENARKKTIERIKEGTFSRRKQQVSKIFNPNTNQIEIFDSKWEEDFLNFSSVERKIPITKMHDVQIHYIDSTNNMFKDRIYLPDFVDMENSRVIEVKGKFNQNACDKIKYAQEWATSNSKTYEVWTKKNNKFYELTICGDIWVPKELYGTSSLVFCKEKSLSSKYLKTLSIRERKILAAKLFRFYRKFGFPFKEPIKKEEMISEFKALQKLDQDSQLAKQEPEFSSGAYKGKPVIDHFYDRHFHEVKNGGKDSLLEAFNDDLKLYRVITNRLGISYKEFFNIHGAMIRQGFRSSGLGSVVSSYSSEYVKHIIMQNYSVQINRQFNMLDFSMGFGQRMLAALSMMPTSQINYIGIDPWDKQIKSARDMHGFLLENNLIDLHSTTIDLYQSGSEDMLDNELFMTKYQNNIDLVYTSPPYFDFECYDRENFAFYTKPEERKKNFFDIYVGVWLKKTMEMISKVLLANTGTAIINVSGKPFKIDSKTTVSLVDEFVKAANLFGLTLIKTHVPKNNKVIHFNKAIGINKNNINSNEILLYLKKIS